jgi:hypothetical protein
LVTFEIYEGKTTFDVAMDGYEYVDLNKDGINDVKLLVKSISKNIITIEIVKLRGTKAAEEITPATTPATGEETAPTAEQAQIPVQNVVQKIKQNVSWLLPAVVIVLLAAAILVSRKYFFHKKSS